MSENTVTEFFRFLKDNDIKFSYNPRNDFASFSRDVADEKAWFPLALINFSEFFEGEDFQERLQYIRDNIHDLEALYYRNYSKEDVRIEEDH